MALRNLLIIIGLLMVLLMSTQSVAESASDSSTDFVGSPDPALIILAHNTHKKVRRQRVSMPKKRYATGRKVFIFDPKNLRWGAYDAKGRLVSSGSASGGRHYCADVKRPCRTPRGVFRVSRKGNAYCKSSKFPLGKGGAPMPYCMFFYRGYAIHGSPDVPNYNASHGCIRVLPEAARWLHYNFIEYGTTVIVRPY